MLNKVVVIFKKIFCFIDKLTPLNYLPWIISLDIFFIFVWLFQSCDSLHQNIYLVQQFVQKIQFQSNIIIAISKETSAGIIVLAILTSKTEYLEQ